ncbi:MAG: hypothetical protein QOJ35_1826 [Solirubrobacteraceae bacterium]|nr:hypothetical protein [Solirubrobacteraceae bacterium]
MPWVEVFSLFVVSHLVGDFALQTDWQAVHKHSGLARGNTVGHAALLHHGASYILAFVPCLIWLASSLSWAVLAVAAAVVVPHVLQDDGRLLGAYMRRVKGIEPAAIPFVALGLDQTMHIVALLLVAIAA